MTTSYTLYWSILNLLLCMRITVQLILLYLTTRGSALPNLIPDGTTGLSMPSKRTCFTLPKSMNTLHHTNYQNLDIPWTNIVILLRRTKPLLRNTTPTAFFSLLTLQRQDLWLPRQSMPSSTGSAIFTYNFTTYTLSVQITYPSTITIAIPSIPLEHWTHILIIYLSTSPNTTHPALPCYMTRTPITATIE